MQNLMLLCSVSVVEYHFCRMIALFKRNKASHLQQFKSTRDMRAKITFKNIFFISHEGCYGTIFLSLVSVY